MYLRGGSTKIQPAVILFQSIIASKFSLYQDMDFKYVTIPGGYTKYLQSLDVSVMRSFKSKLKHQKTLCIS